jgi:5-methylcytosine-specific restriction protein A
MAATHGHGNPPWSREETILALALYLECDGSMPVKTDPRLVTLSDLLRRLPYHEVASRRSSFRNVDGVSFKLQNLRQVATGKGLAHVSAMDRTIWEEFRNAPDRVFQISEAIRTTLGTVTESGALLNPEEEFQEGRLLTTIHLRRERCQKLRSKLLKKRRGDDQLSCDVCGCMSPVTPPEFEDAIFEVHHLVPLATRGVTKIRISDVALVCANCHRLFHRAIAKKKQWLSVKDMKNLITTTL